MVLFILHALQLIFYKSLTCILARAVIVISLRTVFQLYCLFNYNHFWVAYHAHKLLIFFLPEFSNYSYNGGWQLLKSCLFGLGFNGAETKCKSEHILVSD